MGLSDGFPEAAIAFAEVVNAGSHNAEEDEAAGDADGGAGGIFREVAELGGGEVSAGVESFAGAFAEVSGAGGEGVAARVVHEG